MVRSLLKALAQLVMIGLVTASLLETIVALSFRYPSASVLPQPVARYLHSRFDRWAIQMMPACAQFDGTLTYTLRPGHCVFSNREFSNEFSINSAGLRDDEASLQHPATIVIGDSLAMGWGVDESQSFPSLIEQASGLRTLNAGVSSYGTVREFRLLERLDRSRLRNLVIQYHENDTSENERFAAGTFRTLTEAQYDSTVKEHARMLRYVPGTYAFNVLVQLQSLVRQAVGARSSDAPSSAEQQSRHQADLFANVLERSGIDLSGVRVVVVTLDAPFAAALADRSRRSSVKWLHSIEAVDASAVTTTKGALYFLDDHPTAAGHRMIAGAVGPHLER